MIKGALIVFLALLSKWKLDKTITVDIVEREYDFIIVGGGTTGIALAGRLSENENVKVLVIEAGKTDESFPSVRVPGFETILKSEANWDFKTIPQKYSGQALVNQTEKWPRGKILGGTSSMNHLIYNRGSPHDYDSWEDFGAIGWGWEDVEKYFKNAEGAQGENLSKKLGKNGPLKISKAYSRPPIDKIFEEAAKELGIEKTDYIDNLEGFSYLVATKYNGLRMNSVEAYVRNNFPERKRNLHILCEAYVTKILINDSVSSPSAVGVQYHKDGKVHEVYARKDVILSAGVIGSPHLLLLSGIGPEDHLNERGITQVVDSPGVGSNLRDHLRVQYHLYSDKISRNASLSLEQLKESEYEFITSGQGPLTNCRITSFIHHRTNLSGTSYSTSTKKRPFPEIQIAVYPFRSTLRDVQSTYEVATYQISDYLGEIGKAVSERDGIISSMIAVVGLQHSKSTGTIRLDTSDPFQPPLIDPAFLSNDDDVKVLSEGLKLIDKMFDTDTFKDLNMKQVFQPYCKEYGTAVPKNDEYFACWIHKVAVSEYHPCCTAKMGSDDDRNAVVDERLRVRGMNRLRVADASVMPHEISGNPQSVCYMIAEKASDMIKEDWRL